MKNNFKITVEEVKEEEENGKVIYIPLFPFIQKNIK